MFIRGFTPESVLGYLIVPSNVLRNGKSAPAAVSSKKTMLPAGFVAQRTILSTELPCGGTARPFASTLISDQWRHGPSALKHDEHRHDDVFSNRRLVSEYVTDRDPFWQRTGIDQVKS